jgi:hypothetical protein
MPASGTSGSVRDRDGPPPGLLDHDDCREARLVVYTVAVRKSQARTRERTRLGLTGLVR